MSKIHDIANYILKKEKKTTHKKLQKLCYYVEVWGEGIFNKSISEDSFEAWIHGPVNRRLFSKYKGRYNISSNPSETSDLKPEEESLIDGILAMYNSFDGDQLEALSHSELPWLNARQGYSDYQSCTVELSKKDIKKLGKELVLNYKQNLKS